MIPSILSHSLPPSSISFLRSQGMEYCVEARALKPSLRREIDFHSNQNQSTAAVATADEFLCASDAHGGGFAEDFLIENLLDYPEKEAEDEEKDSVSVCSVELETDENGASTASHDVVSVANDAACLAVPQDDLADLEWVSRFVDDSLQEFPPLYPTSVGSLPVQSKTIPVKPRTKRPRLGRVWSVGSSTLSQSSSTFSSNSTISIPIQSRFTKPVAKKKKIKPNPVQLSGSTGQQRRCSHCQVQKTPQWRAGPEGAKTLCNACGVRFKSGWLYPEYRPSCSPTFRADLHSSSHRKVLEMRKRKELWLAVQTS